MKKGKENRGTKEGKKQNSNKIVNLNSTITIIPFRLKGLNPTIKIHMEFQITQKKRNKVGARILSTSRLSISIKTDYTKLFPAKK